MLLLSTAFCAVVAGAAQHDGDEAAYRKAILQRSERVVAPIEITDAAKRDRVVELVAEQYRGLRRIHDKRDQRLNESNDAETSIRDASHRELVELHRRFVAQLTSELHPTQVEQIKDGMTYGVVPITYAAYQRLLPSLSEEQKRFVLANLVEAREYAMDAGSSDEKHAWFGKYKGRINNYLSANGYDLKQAERDLAGKGTK